MSHENYKNQNLRESFLQQKFKPLRDLAAFCRINDIVYSFCNK